mgnify:CR=1 FL=1
MMRHKVAIALSIAVGLLYGAHHIVLSRHFAAQNQSYHPLVVNEDEALFTGPKAHAAEMGEIIVGDFNTYEYKDTRIYVLPFLSPLIMGNLARLTGSIERAFIVGDFLFPPIIFLLFYILLSLLLNLETVSPYGDTVSKRLIALFGATLFIFIPQFLLAMPPVLPYLQATMLTLAAKGSSLYFSRVEDPQLTMPLYLAALVLFLLIFQGRKEKWIVPLAGIFYGLLFYSYFYYWMYLSMALTLGLVLLWRPMPEVRTRLGIAMALGLLISIPHWINASLVAALPQYPDLFDRLRPEIGRAFNFQTLPVAAYFLHASLAAAAWFFLRGKDRGSALFLISFLLPIYAAYNMQLITGFNVHPDHWFKAVLPIVNAAWLVVAYHAFRQYGARLTPRTLVIPWALLAAILFFKITRTEVALVRHASVALLALASLALFWVSGAKRYPWMRARPVLASAGACAIALLFVKGIALQRTFIAQNAAKTIPAQEFASYQWLTEHTPAYSVVATPSFTTSARLQIYTKNRLFLPNGYNTLAGDDELWTRLRLTHALYGTATDTFYSILNGVTDLGGGGEDAAPIDNRFFAFKPSLDRLAVYYLFHMKYLDSAPGSTFRSTSPVVLHAAIVARELDRYEKRDAPAAIPPPYRLDYLYYGPRERLLVPDPSPLSPFRKIYDDGGISVYAYPHAARP